MTEPIRCPGCSTRFALRPDRVHPGIRRAKCFRCDTIFEIGETVDRLLAASIGEAPAAPPPVPEPSMAPPAPAGEGSTTAPRRADHGLETSPLRVDDHLPPVPAEPGAQTAPIRVGDLLPPIPPEAGAGTAPIRVSDFLPPVQPAPAAEPPSLTLGDLEGSEEEIMEKTLVLLPPGHEGQEAPPVAQAPEAGSGAFTSAKDAIAKLMGDAPAAAPAERRTMPGRTTMDVEATLDALDQTLGGTPIPALAPPPPMAPPPPPPMATPTLKLTAQEIQAAMASAGSAPPPPPPLPPRPLPPPREPARAEAPSSAPSQDLLKIQMEQETLTNISIDQVTAWIGQGRVHEYHMVARQFSDNWIEAVKVPALRPAFERKRREDSGRAPEPPPPPPAEVAPPRKGLFGGLFGRN